MADSHTTFLASLDNSYYNNKMKKEKIISE